jgi:hypothetical protein
MRRPARLAASPPVSAAHGDASRFGRASAPPPRRARARARVRAFALGSPPSPRAGRMRRGRALAMRRPHATTPRRALRAPRAPAPVLVLSRLLGRVPNEFARLTLQATATNLLCSGLNATACAAVPQCAFGASPVRRGAPRGGPTVGGERPPRRAWRDGRGGARCGAGARTLMWPACPPLNVHAFSLDRPLLHPPPPPPGPDLLAQLQLRQGRPRQGRRMPRLAHRRNVAVRMGACSRALPAGAHAAACGRGRAPRAAARPECRRTCDRACTRPHAAASCRLYPTLNCAARSIRKHNPATPPPPPRPYRSAAQASLENDCAAATAAGFNCSWAPDALECLPAAVAAMDEAQVGGGRAARRTARGAARGLLVRS